MNHSLEMKLAQLVSYLERREFGTVGNLPRADEVALRHILNDREISTWLDCKRLEGIPPGPFIQ